MTEGVRKLIAVALGLASYTIIALKLGIDAAQSAAPMIGTLVGAFVGANLIERKMNKPTKEVS